MDQKKSLTVEQLQKILLDAEKSGEYSYEELLPIWEEAKGIIENEEQMVSLYTTFIYLTRRFEEKEQNDIPNYSKVEELFHEGSNFLEECFEGYSDANIRFEKNFAWFSYAKLKKNDQAREIWNKLLKGEQSAFPWLEAITLERSFGDIAHARRLFFKALDAVAYRQEEIFSRFVQFEREEGTRDQLDLALARVNAKAAEYNVWMKQQKPYNKNQQKMGKKMETKEQKTAKKKDNGKEKATGKKKGTNGEEKNEQRKKGQKRKEGNGQGEEMEEEETRLNEAPRMDKDERNKRQTKENDDGTSATFETSSIPMGPVLPGIAPSTDKDDEKDEETGEKEEDNENMTFGTSKKAGEKRKRSPSLSENNFHYNTGLEKNKLFVKKLDWACTNEELKKFFEKFGTVADARIVTKWNGRSKGCAYVDFADEQSASAALMGADGAEIRGRRIAVFLSNPPPVKRAKTSTTMTADESIGNAATSKTTAQSTEGKEHQRVKQQTKTASLMPRAAFFTGAGLRIGKASRLMLPMSVISKRSETVATEGKSESPIGVVTESTKEMTL